MSVGIESPEMLQQALKAIESRYSGKAALNTDYISITISEFLYKDPQQKELTALSRREIVTPDGIQYGVAYNDGRSIEDAVVFQAKEGGKPIVLGVRGLVGFPNGNLFQSKSGSDLFVVRQFHELKKDLAKAPDQPPTIGILDNGKEGRERIAIERIR